MGSASNALPSFYTEIFPLASGPPTLAVQAKCDPCLSSPCQNQGTCYNDSPEGYRCACPSGYKVSGGSCGRGVVVLGLLCWPQSRVRLQSHP